MTETPETPRARKPRATVETPEAEPERTTRQNRNIEQAAAIRAYIAYRRAELKDAQDRQAVSPIGGGSNMRLLEETKVALEFLRELEKLAAWLEAGGQEFHPQLTESEKLFYREAVKRGLNVTEEIRAQL